MTFHGDQEVKTTTGYKHEGTAFLAGNSSKAAALTDFRAFCYIVGAAGTSMNAKGLEYEAYSGENTVYPFVLSAQKK